MEHGLWGLRLGVGELHLLLPLIGVDNPVLKQLVCLSKTIPHTFLQIHLASAHAPGWEDELMEVHFLFWKTAVFFKFFLNNPLALRKPREGRCGQRPAR